MKNVKNDSSAKLKTSLFSRIKIYKCSKGKVLIAFFKLANYTPRVVVMLDNKPENLLDIQQELEMFDPSIKFIGLVYKKGSNYAPQDIDETSFKNWWQSRIEKLIENGN